MKVKITACVFMALFIPAVCTATSYGGYPEIPEEAAGFITRVESYAPGPGVSPPYNDVSNMLGMPDQAYTSLGRKGSTTLGIFPLHINPTADGQSVFYVYEKGEFAGMDVYVSSDNVNWHQATLKEQKHNSVGHVLGYVVGGAADSNYAYIKIDDTSSEPGSEYAGADISGVAIVGCKNNLILNNDIIVDTDVDAGKVYNLSRDKDNGSVRIRVVKSNNQVSYIDVSDDDSLLPVALSSQVDFDNDGINDIDVLVENKSTGNYFNIIKSPDGKTIKVIDNTYN